MKTMTSQKLILRLTTGEDILASVTRDPDGDTLTVKDPFVIMSQWANDGTLKMGLMPFMPYAKDNVITVKRDNVIATATPVDEILKQYTKQTSGILLP